MFNAVVLTPARLYVQRVCAKRNLQLRLEQGGV